MGAMHALQFAASPPQVQGAVLRLHVIYTDAKATLASLKTASRLARELDAKLILLVPYVVPFPLPLNSPTAPVALIEESMLALVRGCEVDTEVRVLLCRDREETIRRRLPPESIAVIGRRSRWGAGSAWRLIRAVKRNGYHVIVVTAGGGEQIALMEYQRRASQ
jgi:hypothetical protein